MTIYVDDPMPVGGRFNNWCHMWSATNDRDELDAMAKRLGLKAAWFQLTRGMSGEFPHYDVSPAMRSKALAAGAVYKPLLEWVKERMQK